MLKEMHMTSMNRDKSKPAADLITCGKVLKQTQSINGLKRAAVAVFPHLGPGNMLLWINSLLGHLELLLRCRQLLEFPACSFLGRSRTAWSRTIRRSRTLFF